MELVQQIAKPLRRRYSVRAYINAIVILISIPAILIAAGLAREWAVSGRSQLEQSATQETRELTAALDREIVNVQSTMTVLARTNQLQTGDLEQFYHQAVEVARMLDTQIMLRDMRLNRQVLNTSSPWGIAPTAQSLSPPYGESEEALLRAGKPAVSNVFFGPITKRYVARITVPVVREGTITHLLSVAVPVQRFADLLASLSLDENQIATVVDRGGTIVARSRQHEVFAGTRILNALPAELPGVTTGTNRDGIAFHWFNRRSDASGWILSVGVPDSALAAPSKTALASFAVASGFLLIGAIVLAYFWGERLSQSAGALGIDRKPTREEFQVLFDSAPNGVLVLDHLGLIALANSRVENKFGYRPGELIGRTVEVLIPERLRDHHSGLRKAFEAAPEARPIGTGRELFGRRKDGSEFPVEIGLNPIRTNAGYFVMATVVDITERRRAIERLSAAAAALHASEEQRRFAVESAEIGTWNWDFTSDKIWWSEQLRSILGVPASITPSHDAYFERIHPSDRHIVLENKNRCLSGQRHYEIEYRVIGLDTGTTRWVNSKGRVDCDAAGTPVRMQGAIQDITTRKSTEQERDELRRRLMHAQEQERLRLAQELHDQTGQALAAILLELKGVEALADEAGQERLTRLRKQMEEMGKTLHRVAWELRPASIDELGLAAALTNYVSEWSSQFNMEADFICADPRLDEMPEDVRTTIYRVIQEALTNIAKHATGATSVSVLIRRVEGSLRLTIDDNGCGFDPSLRTKSAGLGLAGMRERIALVGGALEIESSIGAGATVLARIPVRIEDAA